MWRSLLPSLADFNPRSREGSDRSESGLMGFWNFNPRSREGSDTKRRFITAVFTISIHAPAKGATGHFVGCDAELYNFNPRSREGSDPKRPFIQPIRPISIHAPAEGSDRGHRAGRGCITISIHAPREGSDGDGSRSGYRIPFQSTLPRRERLKRHSMQSAKGNFQSTLTAKGATE